MKTNLVFSVIRLYQGAITQNQVCCPSLDTLRHFFYHHLHFNFALLFFLSLM